MESKLKPGDLVKLDAGHFPEEAVQSWGIGIFIGYAVEAEGCYSRVYWIKPKSKADQGFSGWNQFLRKLS